MDRDAIYSILVEFLADYLNADEKTYVGQRRECENIVGAYLEQHWDAIEMAHNNE